MNGADSYFLNIESHECPMNMGLLVKLAPGSDEALAARIRAVMISDTNLTQSLRRKFRLAPFNLDHPIWVFNDDFHVEEHILHHNLTGSKDMAALDQCVAEIMKARLSDEKPLWEFHIIKGLQDGSSAFILKLHHAYADGATGVLLLQKIMDGEEVRNKRRVSANSKHYTVNAVPESDRLAHINWAQLPLQALLVLAFNLGLHLRVFYQYLLKKDRKTAPPPTRFNRLISAERSYTHGQISMTDIRKISTAFQCSRNDVFLAVISGALRNYLSEHDELPVKSLYAGLPLALLNDEKRSSAANQLAFYRSALATDIADPEERLLTISRRLERATHKARAKWKNRLLERVTNSPPRVIRALNTLYLRLLENNHIAPSFNVFTTLMPGPAKKATVANREIKAIHPISIPFHGAGLFVSALRYRDHIDFGIIADQQQIPDTVHLASLMQDACNELLELAREKTG